MLYFYLGCQWALAGVFGTAVWSKLRHRALTEGITGFRMVPERIAPIVGIAFIGAESATTVLLVVPSWTRLGFVLACLLLATFTAALVQAIVRKLHVPCACFGSSPLPIRPRHVVRNMVLFAMAAIGAAQQETGRNAEPAGVVIALATAAVIVLLVRHLDDLADLFGAPPESAS